MKKFLILFLVAFRWASLTAKADDGADVRRALEERYAAMKSAMEKRDANALSSLLAPNFVSIDVAGQSESAAQMIDELKKAPPADDNRATKTTLRSITMNGRTAVVDQLYEMQTSKAAADGSVQKIELRTVSEDTWTNSNGVWRIERTATDQLDYFINGQSALHKTRQR
jgi:ketosteroid isomerase-like protein